MNFLRAGPWPFRLLAVAAGAAAALAHPPFGLLPGLLGYGLLLFLVDQADTARPLKSAFLRGWLAGLAYFAIGTWWVGEAFLVDIASHGWMAPFAVTFMAGGLALFWGAAAALYRLIRPTGVWRVLVFASVLSIFEWLRGHVLTGLPWNLPGETWRAGSDLSQTAALVGAYGLTFLTLAIAGTAAVVREGRGGIVSAGLAATLFASLAAYGAHRLAEPLPPPAGPIVRVVQADIPQSAKYDPDHFRAIVAAYTGLTARPPAAGQPMPSLVIWPEGAIPASVNDYLAENTWTREAIAGALKPGQTLMVGAYRVEPSPRGDLYYNSLVAVRRTPAGFDNLALYDKYRLVPFGEYLPLDSVLSPLGFKNLVHIGDGFTIGPRPRPLRIAGLPPVQVLICYESLFPGYSRDGARLAGFRAAWIANVSNDAWFGATSGPLQHLNLASYRAIEEGLPMIRATPTGVSAVIDAYGRIIPGASLTLGQSGVIDAPLPGALGPTPFSRFGELSFWIMVLFPLLGIILGRYNVRLRHSDQRSVKAGNA